MKWAVLAFVSVLVISCVIVRSFIVYLYSMLLILISVTVNHAVFTSIFDKQFSSELVPALMVHVLLCINDIYLLCESWKQSEHVIEFRGRTRLRLAYVVRRATYNNLVRAISQALIFILTY